jgi:hypothetical protein
MTRTPVKSSNVAAIGFDPATGYLEVEYRNGGIYHYHPVSAKTHQTLMGAPSIGKHLHGEIRPHHNCTKGEAPCA